MGCSSGKIMDELHEIELSHGEFADIKKIVIGMTDENLIENLQYLKRRGIRFTSENIHLWNVYIKWIKIERINSENTIVSKNIDI
jgi:hypothetical protein